MAWKWGQKLWNWVTGKGWKTNDELAAEAEAAAAEEESSNKTRVVRAKGEGTTTQNVILTLNFFKKTSTDNIEIVKTININKNTASNSFIFNVDNNNEELSKNGIVKYEITNESFDWSPDGILVSPASSDAIDDNFYKVFNLKLDISLSKSIIDNVNIHSGNISCPIFEGSDVFSIKYENNTSITFNDEEFGLSDDEAGTNDANTCKRRFAGKILANDEILYPLSNNILTFDYYTKYGIPNVFDGENIYLDIQEKSSSSSNPENTSGVYNNRRRSTGGDISGSSRRYASTSNTSTTSQTSTGTAVRRASSTSRTSTSLNSIQNDIDHYIVKDESKNIVEIEYTPLKTIHLYIDVVLDSEETAKMNIDIFPPIAKDKLSFIPNITELNSINFKKGKQFFLDIHSYFEINSLTFSYTVEKKDKENEDNTSIEKKNYTIIGKKDVDSKELLIFGKIDNINSIDTSKKINVVYEELREINVYNYTFIFNPSIIEPEDKDDIFIEATLSLDQSGAEYLLNINEEKTLEELEDLDCAIKVFSNNTAQGTVSSFALENILIGRPLSDGTFEIAKYKLKENNKSFGDIHVFYGNIHIRKTGDIIKYSTKIENDELIVYIKYNPFAGYKDDSTTMLTNNKLILYNYICVNMDDVIELNLSEIDKSSPVKITNVANISQDSNIVFSSSINIPLVNYSDQTVFIDAADNSNKLQHYTYISEFNENDTTTYLGVRAYKRNTIPSDSSKSTNGDTKIDELFSSRFANLNIDGLTYNTNASLVLLTPYTTQEIIYSFRNGRQTMQVKKSAMDFNYDKTNKQLHVTNLLPTYFASYEYLVDGTEDKTGNGNYNISFYGIAEHKDWVKTNLQYSLSYDINTESYYFSFSNNVEQNKDSYLFTISYIEKEIKESKSEISLLENIDENYPLYNNIYITNYSINETSGNVEETKSNSTIFEEEYSSITSTSDAWKDSDNIYERKISYTKLAPNSISLDDFKTVVKNYDKYKEDINVNNRINENGIYYKYSSISKEYNKYTIEDIENINSTPYNLYYRSEYYLKKAGINESNKDDFISKGIYSKNWTNTEISNPTINDGLVYLHYINGYTYLPLYLGIKYDGSVQYYSGNNYYLIDLNNIEYRKEERPDNNSIKTVYLKQNYTNIQNLNKNKCDELYSKKYKFYRQINPLKFIKISDKETIYSLDLSGDVVYADSNKKIISKNDISYVYYYATTDADNWTKKEEPEIVFNGENEYQGNTNILRNGNKSYLLNSLNCGEDSLKAGSFEGIYYIVDFGGEYIEVSYPEVYNSLPEEPDSESGPSEFYINKEGYNQFDTTNAFLSASFINGKNELEKILNYGYNFEFYLKGISKIDIDKVKEIVENYKNEPLYINVSRLFENCNNFSSISGVIDQEGVSINGTNNSNGNPIKLIEINVDGINAGTIKTNNSSFKYYSRKPVLKSSNDIHNNINKKYYTKENYIQSFGEISLKDNKDLTNISRIDDTNRKIVFTNTSGIPNESNTPNSDNKIRKYNFDTLKFYYKGISYYTTIDLGRNAEEIISYLQPKLVDNNPLDDVTYSYDLLMSSKFFYPSYTVNNGIKSGKDGSYYVNISVFDGKSKFIDKELYLNPHIYTVTNYKYTYFKENEVPVTKDMDLSEVSENEYKNYLIRNHNLPDEDPISVSTTDRTPEWWKTYCLSPNSSYSLSTKLIEVGEEEYNGKIIYNENNKVYQFFDDYTNRPYTIKYNNNIYGLLFNVNPYSEVKSNDFIAAYSSIRGIMKELKLEKDYAAAKNDDGTNTTNEENHQAIYQIIGEQYDGKTKQKENDGVGDGDTFLPEDADFLKAKHYYENIDLTTQVTKINLRYIPHEYEYEIVPLQEFIYKTSGIDDNVFQVRDSILYELKEKNSLELSNAKKINFTGTYTWIAPEFSYISTYKYTYNPINPEERTYEYSAKKVISRSGYWSKDYIEEEVPIKINAYNFYPKDEISSVNISYNFIPFSYIKSAEIYHPEISYDYLINDIYEYYKYTYIINGIEKDYPLDGKIIVNPDNSYSGIIKVLDFPSAASENDREYAAQVVPSDTLSEIKVKLYRKLELGVTPNVKNIVHQKEHTSYNWYAYLQATPLTNEKIPYLYKKEIIPGGKKKIQYWNKGTNSYAVKEVDEYESYWSYEYTYEVVPFKVASYIFTDDLRISNFYDLGAYIIELKDGLKSILSEQADATKKLNSTMTQTGTDLVSSINNASISWNNNYTTQSTNIINSLDSIKNEYNSSLSTLSTILDSSIDDFNVKSTYSLNNLNQKLNESINKETEVINSRLSEGNKISYEKISELSTYIHDDLIGEDSLEIIKTNTELSYLFDIKKNEIILTSKNEETITYNKDSLAKMLKDSLYGYFEHSKISYNEDGTFTKITYSGDSGIAEILANLTVIDRLPDYNQFMVKLVPAMFANVDFENFYEVQYDAYGNVIGTQKRNPINIAKASIYRADTLWKELKKKGIVE